MLVNEVSQTILCISLKQKGHIHTKNFYFCHFLPFMWVSGDRHLRKQYIFSLHMSFERFLALPSVTRVIFFSFLCIGFCWKEGYKRTHTRTFTTESSQLRNNKDPTTISLSNHDCQNFTLLSSGDNLIKLFSLPLMEGQNKLSANFIILPWQQ